jgi:hypothetical protein
MTLDEMISDMDENARKIQEAWIQIAIASDQKLQAIREANARLERILNGY